MGKSKDKDKETAAVAEPPEAPVATATFGPPPPIRRIVVEDEPTIVAPPPPGAVPPAAQGNGTVAPGQGVGRLAGALPPSEVIERMRTEDLRLFYGDNEAVKGVTIPVRRGEVLALIGPSGCGKTTLLRSLNRLTELTPGAHREGQIYLDGQDIDQIEVTQLRRRVSMVFQQPNPFPMSVFDNVAYALREGASRKPRKGVLQEPVAEALTRAGLYGEVEGNLGHPALRLSGGQQQRLCIARALAADPEVLLLDEPCSALDPKSTATIEELIVRLREEVAIVIVTHNLQQAHRVADKVAFMYLGDLIEYGDTEQVFGNPREERTIEYVSGAFG
jgi:phosphate transport system ATP-binding protein